MADKKTKPTNDIHHIVNQMKESKAQLVNGVTTYVFNKNFTPFYQKVNPLTLTSLAESLVEALVTETEKRSAIDYAEFDQSKDKIAVAKLGDISRTETLMHLITNEKDSIQYFDADEHGVERLKGMVFSCVVGKKKVYLVKTFPQNKTVLDKHSFVFGKSEIMSFGEYAAFQLKMDPEAVIIGDEVFIYDVPKFEKLFKSFPALVASARTQAEVLHKKYRLNTPGTVDQKIDFVVESNASLTKRLAEVRTDLSYEDVLGVADDLELELMVDEEGRIIIMDETDAKVLFDILDDNYYTGKVGNYVAKSKREF